MREAVIVSGARTAVGRSGRGTLRYTRPEDLAAETVKEVIRRTKGFDPAEIEDVIIGTAYPEREQGQNLGRIVVFKASLPYSVPGVTVNRFCSSGLQTIAQACERIIADGADVILAGGVESMSHRAHNGTDGFPSNNQHLLELHPQVPQGLSADLIASVDGWSRADCDAVG